MNSSFPNRWSFSYLKFTKYVTNIIPESKYKYGQQGRTKNSTELQQKYRLGAVSIKILGGGGLKPVLRDPNLALSFCYMTRIMNNRNGNVKQNIFSLTESRVSSYWSEVVTVLPSTKQNAMQRAMRTALEWPESHETSKHYKYDSK